MKKVTIISLGWLGIAIYNKLNELNIEVSGAYFNKSKNIPNEYKFDINKLEMNQYILSSDIVILSIPPSKIIDEANFTNLLKILSDKKIIFISSTSVYGNQGDVDEKTIPIPESKNGKRLLVWEEFIRANFKNYQIIRSAGQYGPKRHPGNFLSGKTGIPGAENYINLVSQADLVRVILKVMNSDQSQIINAVNENHPLKK